MDILIADDDPSTCFALEHLLRQWGHHVVVATDGDSAWAYLSQEEPPRLAVLDWIMPGLEGIELCRRIKARTDLFIYTILLTTRNRRDDIVTGLDAGADDFLSKPVDPDELRSRISVGIRTIRYEEQLLAQERSVRLECYTAITETAAARDNETGAHMKRVGLYSRLLGEELRLSPRYCSDLEVFAPLHDIGKVAIPDSILLAPRSLTKEEFAIMKRHPYYGYKIFRNRRTFELAAEISFTHHERFDGKGYPRGLAGEAIPLAGRIVAIADVYDALRSSRPYKPAWPHEKAVETIRTSEGQFDPALVAIFLRRADTFATIFHDTPDTEPVENEEET